MRRHIPISLTLILSLMFTVPGMTLVATAGGTLPVQEMARVDQPDAGTPALAGLTADEQATILDLIRQAEYQFAWQVNHDGEGAYRAPNRANDLSLSLAADGFHAARYREGELLWGFGLSLAAYGQQTFPAAIAEGGLVGSRERIEYHWSPDVVEWYSNNAEGIEHGLTLAAPPPGADSSAVDLTFALRGSLAPELDGDGGALRLKDASGETVLRYDQLAVYDATGRSLSSHFSLSPGGEGADQRSVGEGEVLHLVIDTAGAAYPLTVDPHIHAQVKKLIPSDPEDGDWFGWSVAISGDSVVVGAPYEDGVGGGDRGAAYIFTRNAFGPDSWFPPKKLAAWDGHNEDWFGYSVAISGDTVVVGAPGREDLSGTGCATGTNCGAAYIFERNRGGADNWSLVNRINASDADDYDRFGWSVAISNDTVVVGAPYADGTIEDRGSAYVFERNQGGADNWGQKRLLTPINAGIKQFGHSVAISDDTVVVGAWQSDAVGGSGSGAAFIHVRNKDGADYWDVQAVLTASDGDDGDQFGNAVAISGDTVVVGAYGEDGMRGDDRGAAYVFERNQGGADDWGEVTKLTASDAGNLDYFGDSVAIDVDTIVVGAWGEDGAGSDRGAAYVFERNRGGADGWGQARKLTAYDAEDNDSFGNAVAISGDTIVAGAPWEDGVGSDRGSAYLYVVGGGRWQEVANPHASDAGDEDHFGFSVAISGDTAVVGAGWWEGSSGSDIGAAYVLERNEDGVDGWGQVKRILAADGASGDWFGFSVAIGGDTIVVGASAEQGAGTGRGAAYVFERNYDRVNPGVPKADNWGEVAKLTASDAGDLDNFGFSVGISDDTIVVGAPAEEGSVGAERGAAYLFARNEGGPDNWGQVKKLLASDGQSNAYFGYSVAISGDTVVAGAYRDGASGSELGAAYIFERNQGGTADNWGQVTKLTAADAATGDRFGSSVAIDNDTVVVGAYWEDGRATDRGAAYVFERNQGGADAWGEVAKLTASDAQDDDFFGCSVSISDDTVVVGAYGENGFGFLPDDRGAAYVFERNQGGADDWGQVTKLTASDATDFDWFGRAVSISGDQIVVGASGKNAGGTDRGVAYVFTLQPYKTYLPLVSRNS